MSETYRVFKRNPYRRERGPFGVRWVPNPGARKMTVQRGVSLERALAMCAQGPANQLRDQGREYRGHTFYEFERE